MRFFELVKKIPLTFISFYFKKLKKLIPFKKEVITNNNQKEVN